jgi:FtsP/CotA-like multicopper oxidase with cupredoxin domain
MLCTFVAPPPPPPPPRSTNPAINPLSTADTSSLVPFWVVGTDDGFWPTLSAPMTTLQMGPAERYDVVIDFSSKLTVQACMGLGLPKAYRYRQLEKLRTGY